MSIRKNFGYNLILTLCNYLFPLITYPYVSRVLGADKIGVCGIVDGIVNYFVIFSMLGIGSYGVREIARCGSDLKRRSSVFTNLFIVNVLLTIISVAILVVATLYFDRLQPYKPFLFIGVLKIVFNLFLIEWFFQGIERFKYITLRSVAVNTVYVVSVLLFVKNSNDVLLYYLLTTLVVVVNALCNWYCSRAFRQWNFKGLCITGCLLPIFTFGYYRVLTSMYTTFNVIFLGFVAGDTQAGYFTTATKLYTILMAVFTAFTTVMIPRVSAMLHAGEHNKLQRMANDTFDLLFLLSLPLIIFVLFFSPQIISLLAGSGYEGAILPFRIVILLLIVIGMEQIVVQQFLMASPSNRPIMIVSTLGAFTGIAVNLWLTPRYGAVGSALAWSFSEVAVLVAGLFMMKRYVSVDIEFSRIMNSLLYSLPYVLIDGIIYYMTPSDIAMWVAVPLNVVLFILINVYIKRNEQLMIIADSVISKFTLKR